MKKERKRAKLLSFCNLFIFQQQQKNNSIFWLISSSSFSFFLFLFPSLLFHQKERKKKRANDNSFRSIYVNNYCPHLIFMQIFSVPFFESSKCFPSARTTINRTFQWNDSDEEINSKLIRSLISSANYWLKEEREKGKRKKEMKGKKKEKKFWLTHFDVFVSFKQKSVW